MHTKSKNIICKLPIFATFILAFAGCGGDSSSNASTENQTPTNNSKGNEIICDAGYEGLIIKPVDSDKSQICKDGKWEVVEEEPASSAAEPESSADEPKSSASKPASSADEPKSSASKPKSSSSVAKSSAAEPKSSASEPESSSDEPAPNSDSGTGSSAEEPAQSSSATNSLSSSSANPESSSETHIFQCDDETYVIDLDNCEKISSSSKDPSSSSRSEATESSNSVAESSSIVAESSAAEPESCSSVEESSSSVVESSSIAASSSSVEPSSSSVAESSAAEPASSSSEEIVSSSSAAVSSSSEESSSSVLEIHRTWSSQAVVKNMPAGTYDCNIYNCRPTTYLSPSRLKENEFGEVLDTRDNQVYRTKILSDNFTDTLGNSRTINQTWFVQDLNYDYEIDAMVKCVAVGCDKEYGRLYAWAAAMDTLVTGCGGKARSATCNKGEKHQGLCPTGWHVPDSAEVALLKHYIASWLLKYATVAEAGYYLKKAGHLSYEYTQCRWPWVATGGWATKRENDSYCQHSEDMDLFGLAFLPEDFTDKDESTIGDWSQSSCFWLSNDGVLKKNTNAQSACFDGFGAVINTGSSTNSPGVHIAPDANGNYSKTYIRCLKDEDNN